MESKHNEETPAVLGIPVVSSTNVREMRTYQKYKIAVPLGLQPGDEGNE